MQTNGTSPSCDEWISVWQYNNAETGEWPENPLSFQNF